MQAAATWGKLAISQFLLDNDADVNTKGGYFGNALQAAVAVDQPDIAELLLARRANVDPPGLEWEQLIAQVREDPGDEWAERLRKFQENPTGYIELRLRERELRRARKMTSRDEAYETPRGVR